ncbi:hypothetical protein [Leisingera sp.]|uniref:hypothetical protein n=1 Tax=Leisingera sp. TaxID=1879318 RepID=UPI002B26967E|nr:hypothetical protein [Leisingera sp.]
MTAPAPGPEPDGKRPLVSHPRLSLMCRADFIFVRFAVTGAHLNGGFGKAFRLAAADLHPPGSIG